MIIADSVKATLNDPTDVIMYQDVPNRMVERTKRMEMRWDRDWKDKRERLTEPFAQPDSFYPLQINKTDAFGMVSDTCEVWKKDAQFRELCQFIDSWVTTLMRVPSQTKWKIVNDRFIQRCKRDANFKPALKTVLTNEVLLSVYKQLPEAGEKGMEMKDGIVERPDVQWVMESRPFALDIDSSEAKTKVTMVHNKHHKAKREWKPKRVVYVYANSRPAMVDDLLVYQLSATTIRIDYKESTWYWTTDKISVLSCCISPNGRQLAVCTEFEVIIWNVDETKQALRVTLDPETLITSICLTNDDLCMGTLTGQYLRLNWARKKCVCKTLLPDKLAIMAIRRVADKTVCQTIHSLHILESEVHQDQVIQINTTRPMTFDIRGTMLVCLSKYGSVNVFSLIHRNIYKELAHPYDFHVRVEYLNVWYANGVCIAAPDSSSIHVLYPDGQIRDIIMPF